MNDERSVSLLPELNLVKTRKASSGLGSAVSRKDEVSSFSDPSIAIDGDIDLTIPMPSMPKQMDEFLSLLTGTEPSEMSELVASAVPTETSESEAPIANRVSAEPSETGDMLSNSSVATPIEPDRFSSPTSTPPSELEEPFAVVKSATPNGKDRTPAGLDSTETHAVGDSAATLSVTELEKVFAKFSLPGRGEIYESRATASTGYQLAWKRNATSIGRIGKYLAIVAVLVLVSSLLTYWIWPSEDVSRNSEVTARDFDESQPGSDLQPPTIVEGDVGTKQSVVIEWQSAFQPGSGDRSIYRRVRGSSSENSPPITAASNPPLLATVGAAEPDQLTNEKPLPTRKRGKAERKKVTVDDLINDKKKVTVDDLINDN